MKHLFKLLIVCICLCSGFSLLADTEPDNDTYTGADIAAQNDTLTGSINDAEDATDWYQFTTDNDGTIIITLVQDGYYMYLALFDSDGTTQIGSTADGYAGDSIRITQAGLQAGTYYAKVTRYLTHPGNYTLFTALAAEVHANDSEPNDDAANAQLMNLDDSVEGHINFRANGGTRDTYDFYELTTDNDGTINLTMVQNGYYAYVALYDSDGTTILGSEEAGYAGDSIVVSVAGLAAGTYYIRVRGHSSYHAGYTLSNELIPNAFANDTEPNDSSAIALTIPTNSTVEGHINFRYNGGTRDTYDFYELTTDNDGTINLTMVQNGYYAYVALYDSDGTTILGSEEAGYAGDSIVVSVAGLAAGTYYIRVRGHSSYHAGYTLSNELIPNAFANDTEPNDSSAIALTIPTNSTVEGHINFRYNGGTRDTYDFYELTTDNDGTINLTMVQNGYYAYVALYDSDGTTILGSEEAGYAGDSIVVSVAGLAAGTYYIRVRGHSSYHAGYTLSNELIPNAFANDTEPNDSSAIALTIPTNSTVEGHINFRYNGGTRDTYDFYELTTDNDGTINLTMVQNGYYAYVALYDSDGTTILGSEEAGYAGDSIVVSVAGLAAGTYYIRVRGHSSYHAGYTLSNELIPNAFANDTEPNDSSAIALTIPTNSTVEGHINFRYNGGTRDTYDYYAVTLSSPGDLSVTLDHDGYYAYLRLFDTDGTTPIGSEDAGYEGDILSVAATDLPAGTYFIRVRGYGGSHAGYTMTNTYCPDTIAIVAEGETTLCEGESVVLSTPDHHWSYLWNDGSTTETNTATLTGDFSLTVDNGGGCVRTSNTISIDITPNPVAILEADGPTEFCEGGSVTITANVPGTPDAYLWNTGETTASITVTESGDYSVTVYKNDCSAISDPIAITVNPLPEATITADGATEFCEGEDVILTASGGDSYLWSTGETSESITVTGSGSYSVTVTDANGCSDVSDAVAVSANPHPEATITADGATEFCEGGDVILTASAGDSYLWSTGETTASITVMSSGSYSVTVTENGCSSTSAATEVTVNPNPEPVITADGPTTFCEGESVNLSAGAYSGYLWSTGETTETINVTASGYYSVTVTDANGCMGTSAAVAVTAEECGELVITADGPTTFCEGGSVILTSSEEAGNLWSTGETTQSITVTASGDYSCTNDGNTSNTITVTVNPNPEPVITADGPTTFCEGESVNLSAGAYSGYLWSTGETTETINVTASGSYSVTVTDANGCMGTSAAVAVTAEECEELVITADGPTTFCEGGSVILTSSEETGNLWSTGETTQSITVTASGDYSCTNDGNTSNTITVTVNPNPEPVITADGPTTFCEGESVNLSAGAYSGYLWSTGETTETINVTASGSYSVTVTDANGCMGASAAVAVTVDAASVSVTPAGPEKICFEGSILLTATASAGDLQWQKNGVDLPGETGATLLVTESGKYTCTVTNGSCDPVVSNEVKLSYYKQMAISPAGPSYICDGSSVTLSVPYVPTVSYQWYKYNTPITGATSNTYEATTTGKYKVVSTKDGCSRISNNAWVIVDCRLAGQTAVESELWPNPASEAITITTTAEGETPLQIQIYDMSGRAVYSITYTQTYAGEQIHISLPELASGLYEIAIRYPDGAMNQHPLVIGK